MDVGDYVIVPADIRGTGEDIKAMITDIEPGILGSASLITCLYLEPPVNALGETCCVCYDYQVKPLKEK